MQEDLKTSLEAIGLSDKESAIYLATLELGEGTITRIANRTKLKRTTTYNVIQSMADEGLLSVTTRKGVQYISALSPALLMERTKRAYDGFSAVYQHLVLLGKNAHLQPRVQFFPGIDGIKHCYRQVEHATGDVVGFTNYDTMPQEVFDYIQQVFIPIRKKRKIPARFIVPHSVKSKRVAQLDNRNAIAHKLIPNVETSTHIEMFLMNHTDCYFLSYGEKEIYAIRIQSKTVYDMLRILFELQWRNY